MSAALLLAYPASTALAQSSASEPARTPAGYTAEVAPPHDIGTEQAKNSELAHKLQNPISNMISVPLQNNFDFGVADGAFRYTLNVEPVVPLQLSKDVRMTSRTILPIMYQESTLPGEDNHGGIGDIQQSFFFGPAKDGRVMWGVGPALLLPTATSDVLGASQWAVGPTAVVLVAPKPWTAGILANHLWGFSDDEAIHPDINTTYLQPFVSYTTPNAVSFTGMFEATHYPERDAWSLPLVFGASQVVNIAGQSASLGLMGKWWLAGPQTDPEWGLRFVVTLLMPRVS